MSSNVYILKSHLRGKTKPKIEKLGKDEFYDWVEREHRMNSEKNSRYIVCDIKTIVCLIYSKA